MSGLLCFVGSQNSASWKFMLDDLAILGTDNRGDWHDSASMISLGRNQFFNTPEARQELPVVEWGECALVWSGRLDKREPLLAGHTNITDAQLIIESYRRWGKNCLKHLQGNMSLFCGIKFKNSC